jgi:hypothetical protein
MQVSIEAMMLRCIKSGRVVDTAQHPLSAGQAAQQLFKAKNKLRRAELKHTMAKAKLASALRLVKEAKKLVKQAKDEAQTALVNYDKAFLDHDVAISARVYARTGVDPMRTCAARSSVSQA